MAHHRVGPRVQGLTQAFPRAEELASQRPLVLSSPDRYKFRLALCDARLGRPSALLDALAYTKAARAFDIPTALEISRSGSGAHVWISFADAVAASTARRGEGFDCPGLDTVFLVFPMKFKGRVVQYVGRVVRPYPEKTSIEVHHYVDSGVPVLAYTYPQRCVGYTCLGFLPPEAGHE